MHRRSALLTLAVLGSLLLAACAPTPDAEARYQRTNASRAAARVGPLERDLTLEGIAEAHARRMRDRWVAAGCPADVDRFLVHTTGDLSAKLPPGTPWMWLAENIGLVNPRGPATARDHDELHRLYMGSAAHRRNILSTKGRKVGSAMVYGPSVEDQRAGRCRHLAVDELGWTVDWFLG